MRHFKVVLALVFLSLPVWAGQPRIVCTTTDLASVARAVAGPEAKVSGICSGKEDPHFLTAKPGFILQARDADLWIRIGMELEIGWEPAILNSARNPRIQPGNPGHLDASENIWKLEVPAQRITRAMGDVHPMGNPHYWLDPRNMRIVAGEMGERLAALFPDKAREYRAGARDFQEKLDRRMFGETAVKAAGGEALWQGVEKGTFEKLAQEKGFPVSEGWRGRMAPCRGMKIVTHHKSWEYLADRFGMVIVAHLEPVAGVPPTARHLADVKGLIRSEGARLVLVEPYYNAKAARNAAEGTSASVVIAPNTVGGDPAAMDYFALMDLIVGRIKEALN